MVAEQLSPVAAVRLILSRMGSSAPAVALSLLAAALLAVDVSGQGSAPAELSGLIFDHAGTRWLVRDDGIAVAVAPTPAGRHALASPDGDRALYVESGDIWLLDFLTGETRNLTRTADRSEASPTWWPNQRELIACRSWLGDRLEGECLGAPTLVAVDGSDYIVLGDECSTYALSPDGALAAYDAGSRPWLWTRERGARLLDMAAYAPPSDPVCCRTGWANLKMGSPAFSPNSRLLAWMAADAQASPDLAFALVLDLARQEGRLLHRFEPVGRGGWFQRPDWSPDGAWVSILAESVDSSAYGRWLVSAYDAADEHHLGQDATDVIWSPDARRLVYSTRRATDERALWLLRVGQWVPERTGLPANAVPQAWLRWARPSVTVTPQGPPPQRASFS